MHAERRRSAVRTRCAGWRRKAREDRGLALIATLWVMAVLSVLATEYLYVLHLENRIARNLVDRTSLEYAAKAGIAEFTRKVVQDETNYDSTDEDWAEAIEGELADPMRSEATYRYSVNVTDENARVNVNEIDQAFMERVIAATGSENGSASTLASAVIQARQERPFLTVGDLARVDGMTTEVLYGSSSEDADTEKSEVTPLINLVTVYSVDKNVQASGQARTNIADADANALVQGLTGAEGNSLVTQAEADAIVAYRSESPFDSIGNLLDVPAVTQSVLDGARERLSTEDQEERVNVNTAAADQIAGVQGFDQGTAEDVVRHRDTNGNYGGVDQIRDAKVFTADDMKALADKVTVSSEETLRGVVNVNTADAKVLAMLPGMDEQKAQGIVERRGSANEEGQSQQSSQAQPFENIGALLDVAGFDPETFKQVANFVTYRTQVFRVEAQGLDGEQKALATIEAVLDRSGDRVVARHWLTR